MVHQAEHTTGVIETIEQVQSCVCCPLSFDGVGELKCLRLLQNHYDACC
jgi:hypothetical protein